MNIPVSVIIPVFNNEDTVERAILSVSSCGQVVEVLVIDDGSTDSSLWKIEELAKKNDKVKILYHSTLGNKGACVCRNLGVKHSKGEWIQFLDADDEIIDGKIQEQIALIKDEVSLIIGKSIYIGENLKTHLPKNDKDIWTGLIRGKIGNTCSNLWNKKYIVKVGGWDEKLSSSQEYDLMFRILQMNSNVRFSNGYFTRIYKSNNSISTSEKGKEKRIKNWLNLRFEIRDYLIKNDIFSFKRRYYYYGSIYLYSKYKGFEINDVDVNAFSKLYYYIYKVKSYLYFFIKKR